MRLSYDAGVDILYVSFGLPPSRVHYIEKETGDILRVDSETGRIVGVTIQFFLERISGGERIEIPEIGLVPFNAAMIALAERRIGNDSRNKRQ